MNLIEDRSYYFNSYRIVREFEQVRAGALMKPEDTKEVMDLMKFVEVAQTKTIIKLKQTIKVNINNYIIFNFQNFLSQIISFVST